MNKLKKYDVVIVGGGAAGVSCAWNAGRLGLKTLLIEKSIHIGGDITSALVVPAMKVDTQGINTNFFNELVAVSKKYNAQITYSDGNSGWFNPELLKMIFDEMLENKGVDILFNAEIVDVNKNNSIYSIKVINNTLSLYYETNNIVDATASGKIFEKLNCEFLSDSERKQALSYRFIMSGVNLKEFADWIMELDKDRDVTTSAEIGGNVHLSTAYTSDKSRDWALRPVFDEALKNNDLKLNDTAYFQVFSVAGMPDSLAFNCPRLFTDGQNGVFSSSKSIIEGRRQIFRLSEFCKKYLKGFKNAYISNIADKIGVRETRRVKGKYVYSEIDIINKTTFENTALACDYPIDIHSEKNDDGELTFTKGVYYLPIEALISEKYDNLFVIGKCFSGTFKAQAALRTQVSCFSMGESVAKWIKTGKAN